MTGPHRESSVLPRRRVASGRESNDRTADAHLDALLDEALAATFPASDPIALSAPPAQLRTAHRPHSCRSMARIHSGGAQNNDAAVIEATVKPMAAR